MEVATVSYCKEILHKEFKLNSYYYTELWLMCLIKKKKITLLLIHRTHNQLNLYCNHSICTSHIICYGAGYVPHKLRWCCSLPETVKCEAS